MTKRFKIEPDLTCPELAGYKLPPCSRGQEDGVEKQYSEELDKRINIAKNYKGQVAGRHPDAFTHEEMKGMLRGYIEAREKYEFTESDLRRALSMAFIAVQDGGNITSDEIIASLRTPRHPIAIEVEIVRATLDGIIFPATNPDGTVKGRWVYE